jgi:hypothetical protein
MIAPWMLVASPAGPGQARSRAQLIEPIVAESAAQPVQDVRSGGRFPAGVPRAGLGAYQNPRPSGAFRDFAAEGRDSAGGIKTHQGGRKAAKRFCGEFLSGLPAPSRAA